MADTELIDLPAATLPLTGAEIAYVLQGGADRQTTVTAIVASALPLAGGAMTGAIVLSADNPTIDRHPATKLYVDGLIAGRQPLDPTLTALAALDASTGFVRQTGVDTFVKGALTDAEINAALTYTAANAAALNASALTLGTIPDGRFPATLPALNGSLLTNLNATNLASGTVDLSRLPTITVAKGGTGLTALGTPLQIIRVNAGGTAFEFADAPGGISGLTTNALPYATSATTLGDSPIYRCAAARIGFGGTTDSEPGIRWSSTMLDFVTAAAGAFIGINVLYLQLANTTKIKTVSDGVATITDSVDGLGSLRVQTLQIGNSAAATTPGTVTDKIEIFDAAGASLGFIAVYDAIT